LSKTQTLKVYLGAATLTPHAIIHGDACFAARAGLLHGAQKFAQTSSKKRKPPAGLGADEYL
jgi:hypothetical protein